MAQRLGQSAHRLGTEAVGAQPGDAAVLLLEPERILRWLSIRTRAGPRRIRREPIRDIRDVGVTSQPSVWSRARQLAERTPESRNRYVDFLRAASISVVVIGHWLMAAPWVEAGQLQLGDMLHLAPWTRWLTWAFQVMPLFFIVGGFANAASWDAARRAGQGYGRWTAARLRRLVGPVVPLLVVWSLMAAIAHRFGVHPRMIQVGSQVALIPTWFLAVYVMVVVAVPATHWAWRRYGVASFWGLALGAVGVDALAFGTGLELIRWLNYAFVWLGVHQLGYLWRYQRISSPGRALAFAAGGLTLLCLLVGVGSYPISMITVPGEEVSNSRPPTLALLALGIFHGGLVLAVQAPLRRWLQRPRPWALTILVNASIMTVYLWHVTVLALVVGLANLLGGIGLGLEPGTGAWWLSRPLWLLVLAAGLALLLPVFGRFEREARGAVARPLPGWRALGGAAGVCAGLALLALGGIGDASALGVRIGPVLLTLAGAALVLGVPSRRTR